MPGYGSRFVLDVPIDPCDAPEDAPEPEVVDPTPSAPPRAALRFPSRDVLELAQEGSYRTVSRQVEELATADPALRPFADALGAMARDLDEEGVERLLVEGLA